MLSYHCSRLTELQQVNENSEHELVLTFAGLLLLRSLPGDFWSATFSDRNIRSINEEHVETSVLRGRLLCDMPFLDRAKTSVRKVADRKSLVGFGSNTGHEG